MPKNVLRNLKVSTVRNCGKLPTQNGRRQGPAFDAQLTTRAFDFAGQGLDLGHSEKHFWTRGNEEVKNQMNIRKYEGYMQRVWDWNPQA